MKLWELSSRVLPRSPALDRRGPGGPGEGEAGWALQVCIVQAALPPTACALSQWSKGQHLRVNWCDGGGVKNKPAHQPTCHQHFPGRWPAGPSGSSTQSDHWANRWRWTEDLSSSHTRHIQRTPSRNKWVCLFVSQLWRQQHSQLDGEGQTDLVTHLITATRHPGRSCRQTDMETSPSKLIHLDMQEDRQMVSRSAAQKDTGIF